MESAVQLAHRTLDRAGGSDGDLEAYVEHRVVTTVQAGSGGIRHVGRADTQGVGIRTVLGTRAGYASTTDITDDGLIRAVASARDNARASDRDPAGCAFTAPIDAEPIVGLCQGGLTEFSMASKLALVKDLSRHVLALDPRVRRLDTTQWRDEHRDVATVSTRGVRATYESASAELWCDVVGDDPYGAATDHGYWWGRDPGEVNIDAVAAEAVTRTVRLLGPALPRRRIRAVVFDPEVSALLLDAIGRSLTGGAMGSGRSPFAARLGEPVAAELVVLVDDGRFAGGRLAAPYDDEGVPRRTTALIERGTLVGVMHSSATAASMADGQTRTSSTGNARRRNHKSAARAAPAVLRLKPSGQGDAMDGDTAYIQQVSGSVAGISSLTGRVNIGGIGYLRRDGETAGRLPTLPIATSLQSLLTELVSVGDDGRVILDQPAIAPTLGWRPEAPLAWEP